MSDRATEPGAPACHPCARDGRTDWFAGGAGPRHPGSGRLSGKRRAAKRRPCWALVLTLAAVLPAPTQPQDEPPPDAALQRALAEAETMLRRGRAAGSRELVPGGAARRLGCCSATCIGPQAPRPMRRRLTSGPWSRPSKRGARCSPSPNSRSNAGRPNARRTTSGVCSRAARETAVPCGSWRGPSTQAANRSLRCSSWRGLLQRCLRIWNPGSFSPAVTSSWSARRQRRSSWRRWPSSVRFRRPGF